MEFANNSDLTKIISVQHTHSQFKLGTIDLMWQILSGVNVLHKNGLIHRDLKPDNVMLHKTQVDGKERIMIKITDYGLIRNLNTSMDIAKTQCGTPLLMAPETLNLEHNPKGIRYNKKADVWSCGMVFYQMVTGGKHPFETARDMKDLTTLIRKEIKRPAALTPIAGRDFGSSPTASGIITNQEAMDACWILIARLVAFKPDDRPTVFEAMHSVLFKHWGNCWPPCTATHSTRATFNYFCTLQQEAYRDQA